CVNVGVAMKGRNLQWLDSECAARIAGELYRLFESIADGDSDADVAAKLEMLAPAAMPDRAFYDVAAGILQHRRATWLANMRRHHAVAPGSFLYSRRRRPARPPRPGPVAGARPKAAPPAEAESGGGHPQQVLPRAAGTGAGGTAAARLNRPTAAVGCDGGGYLTMIIA